MSNLAERVPTGIPGLDTILMGGLIPGRTYVLIGKPGTGKTILSLQWLAAGRSRGERGLYITLAEPADQLAANVAGFGWNLEDIDVRELTPIAVTPVKEEYTIFRADEVESPAVWNAIYEAVEQIHPARLVIDSVASLRVLSVDEYQFRKHMLSLVSWLNHQGCTTLLLLDPETAQEEHSIALTADGVIRLWHEIAPARLITLRGLQVEKFRGSDFLSGVHPLRITSAGVVVFPHIIEPPGHGSFEEGKLPSGIPELDEMLHGGLELGTSTIISGPAGVGKTSLGLQFISQAVRAGMPSVVYSFEEPTVFMRRRAGNLGIPVHEMTPAGLLEFHDINPMTLYPDEFLTLLREDVEVNGRKVVMLDSTRGYNIAMEQFGSLNVHLHNMLQYLHQKGVTVLLINEVERLTGELVITEIGVSYIVDNVILLRYAEVDGRLMHVISCLKKRLGDFESEIREYRITPTGIRVGHRLEGLRGVLTGVPERR